MVGIKSSLISSDVDIKRRISGKMHATEIDFVNGVNRNGQFRGRKKRPVFAYDERISVNDIFIPVGKEIREYDK